MEGDDLQKLVKKQAKIISEQAKVIAEQAKQAEQQTEIIKGLEERIVELEAQIVELQATIARLQKDSSNSSKPPSSDIVKPKTNAQKRKGGKKRKIGGQPGHKKHERTPFPPEQVDQVIERTLDVCPVCGGRLEECEEMVVKQQIEMVEKPFIVKEYRCHTYTCSGCQTKHTASAPKEASSGLFSISLIAFVAYLKGRCHVSFSALKDFFREVLGIIVSSGFLVKQIKKAGSSLKRAHEMLIERLKGEGRLHIDESGWKENGAKRWIWAFRAEKYAVFVIRESRGEEVLEEILGLGFRGIIICDFFGAYRKFERLTAAVLQFCWAHFIREVLFLLKIEDERVRRYGRRVLKQIRKMFETIHRKGEIAGEEWKALMHRHEEQIVKRATGTVPEHNDAQLIAKRMREWEEEYFRFIDNDIEPTNNPAELTIRQSVLDRVVTQGSRGTDGNEWHERFWTVLTTCSLQNISVMNYLKRCLSVYFGLDIPPDFINLSI